MLLGSTGSGTGRLYDHEERIGEGLFFFYYYYYNSYSYYFTKTGNMGFLFSFNC